MIITNSNFNKSIKNFFLYEEKPILAVGVSGGPDSIALTLLLEQWVKINKGKLIALIVDHKIRKESYFESLRTKNFLDSRGIANKILSITKNKVKNSKMSEARVNRFEKLINYCTKSKIFHLFLGHHCDDNIETFLLRKIAGSNLEGLNCMQFVTVFRNIQIVRPLLSYSKKEILSFNKKLNVKFINDPSNSNSIYSRAAVRKYLSSNKIIKKKINSEFKIIKKHYFLYKKMIFHILNLLIIDLQFKKLIIDANKFLDLDYNIKSKILDIAFKYVNNENFQIRSKKIDNLINQMTKFHSISLKSHQTIVKRDNNLITVCKVQ